VIDVRLALGALEEQAARQLAEWADEGVARRLWERDTTLWSPEPRTPELADRLGWLDLPETSPALLPELAALVAAVPFWMTDLVLLGMGGSSLAPEVVARTLGGSRLPLTVMDTTHPRAVRDLEWIHPANTLFVVSSKSGTTIETLSLFRHFWSRAREVSDTPGDHFIAVTDPGTPLATLARERGFRAVIEASADVGGRFSALGPFGIVPAALMGVDLSRLFEAATVAADACREPGAHNPGLRLAAALSGGVAAGRDKLTLVTDAGFAAFPDWAEQLVAESTGKGGRGIVPVAHEPALDVEAYGDDRLFVGIVLPAAAAEAAGQWGEEDEARSRLDQLEEAGHPVVRVELDDPEDLFGLFFIWEVAVAVVGSALGVNPFDQPDVQLAKELARRSMSGEPASSADSGELPDVSAPIELDLAWDTPVYGHAPGAAADPDVDALEDEVREFVESVGPGDYIGIQAYLAGGDEEELEGLQRLREALTEATGAATTLGYGPRFLHSTGQLHKGGPATGAFIQIIDDAPVHVHVPETDFTFHRLIRAQSAGDLQALVRRGRRVLRVRVGESATGIERLATLVDRASEVL